MKRNQMTSTRQWKRRRMLTDGGLDIKEMNNSHRPPRRNKNSATKQIISL